MKRLSIAASLLCLAALLTACFDSASVDTTALARWLSQHPTTPTTPSMTTVPTAPTTTQPAAPLSTQLPAWGECPTAVFPNLSTTAGAGAGYAMPAVSANCTATEVIVASNGMPSYTFVPRTPNPLAVTTWSWHVPLRPVVAAATTSIVDRGGTLGFTVTGLPIYGPTEGPTPVAEAYGDPVYNGILDTCGGHTGPQSEYHYHALHSVAACNLNTSYILGYALDGFPIYNSVGCIDLACSTTAVFTSGYDMTGNPHSHSWLAYTYNAAGKTNVLDQCNGRIGPDGTYRYHATSVFPYTFGCFKGLPTAQSGNAGAPMPPMPAP